MMKQHIDYRRSGKNAIDQAGMVSMLVTMIMMLVITLIILGFAQVSRREQRQSLDRHLSSQAFFAAESAVNDARKVVQQAQAAGLPIPEKDTCPTSPSDADYPFNPVINNSDGVKYTCLLVTTKLKNLIAKVGTDHSVNLPFEPATVPVTMHLDWAADPALVPATGPGKVSQCDPNIPNSGYFPKGTSWNCPYGVLRVDFVPTDSLERGAMEGGQKTVFFYPTRGAAPSLPWANADGAIAPMNCSFATNCDIAVTGIPPAKYSLRISAIYQSGSIDISATDPFNAPVELNGGQIQVDATGKAQDVLRRIQVRLAAVPSAKTPDYALETGSSICKRFEISPDVFKIPGDIRGQDMNNPMCKTLSVSATPPLPPCTVGKDIVLALDNSGSMYKPFDKGSGLQKIDKLQQVVDSFIQNSGVGPGNNENHEAIITFSGGGPELQMRSTLTDNIPKLRGIVANIGIGSGTLYLPPLGMAETDGWSTGQTRQTLGAKKILVFVTDGYNNSENAAAIISKANTLKSQGVTIYTIGINPNGNQFFVTLRAMASGSSYFTDALDEATLDATFKQIAGDVKCTP